jgi:hypothetical protein
MHTNGFKFNRYIYIDNLILELCLTTDKLAQSVQPSGTADRFCCSQSKSLYLLETETANQTNDLMYNLLS